MDVFVRYERGLHRLLERLGNDHQRYVEALTLQSRLLENIAQTRQYGDMEIRRAERAQILDMLNRLALEIVGVSFHEWCESATDAPQPPITAKQPGYIGRIVSWVVGLRVWYGKLPPAQQVGIIVALIGLIGTLGAALIGEVPELLSVPTLMSTTTPTLPVTVTQTSTGSPLLRLTLTLTSIPTVTVPDVAVIREQIVSDPIAGAKALSEYLATNPKWAAKRNEVDLKRTELERIQRDTDLFSPNPSDEAAKNRAVYFLLRVCMELEQSEQ
jgi:hypothetical protein